MEVLLSGHSCCLAIVDLGVAATSQALKAAKKLRRINPNLNIVFVGLQALSDEEEARLHQYSDSIIIKAAQSEQRLLKNIERFLNAASQNLENPAAGNVKQQNGGGQRLAGRHILVVDDDARNLFVITAALERQGAKVNGVLSGKSALEFLQKQTVDLVFMDIMMPGMDGYQTITALRRNPAMAATPVVVLTAKSLAADREQALAAGADDYLAKPADFDVLVNMAAVWCANKRGAKNNP
jgi:CheY-like chemotaxis protein